MIIEWKHESEWVLIEVFKIYQILMISAKKIIQKSLHTQSIHLAIESKVKQKKVD